MRPVYKAFSNEVKLQYWRLVVVIVLMILVIILEALAPWPFKFLIDNVLGNSPMDYSMIFGSRVFLGFLVVFMFFLINIFLNIVEYAKSTILKYTTRQIIFNFSQRAFQNIEKLNLGFFRNQEIGDYIYRLSNDVSALETLIEEGYLPLITSVLYLLVTTVILFFINPLLTAISILFLPFLAVSLYFFNRRIMFVSRRLEVRNSSLFSFIEQSLSQMKIIQAFSQEKLEAKKFSEHMRTSLQTEYKLNKLNFILSLLMGVMIATSYSLIIAYGISSVVKGELTTGLLVIFIFYLDNLTTPILSIIYAVSTIKENMVKIDHMDEFFKNGSQSEKDITMTVIKDTSIEFKHVSINSKGENKILDNISFKAEAGKLTVIVGVSGSGKTSILSLIPRLIQEPDSGKIFLGDHELCNYDINVLRENISIVPQENILFNDTIRDIITFGKPDATDKEVKEAARLAIADEFIDRLPGGYNFRVGEGGNFLSGGQRQRLMIARAFLKNPEIYMFDEPISSLDIKTREEVWTNIEKVTKGKTTIIVTNILEPITKADQVIVINKGKIVTTGKHKDLVRNSHLYKLILRVE